VLDDLIIVHAPRAPLLFIVFLFDALLKAEETDLVPADCEF
jgi:hypothetical protein